MSHGYVHTPSSQTYAEHSVACVHAWPAAPGGSPST